ncbi:Pseudouridine synthase, RsuA/RluA-like [Dillenia turbinata]|uniref:Pseudouridine synthase, RsuA/RluA-like n=1 Tax=Dillenia turbinata TaxID=194707 RepID=A0AAN8Z9D0_9MAGN
MNNMKARFYMSLSCCTKSDIVASKRNSEELIFEGKVTVNGSFAEPLRFAGTFVHLGIKSQKSVVSLFDDYLKSGYVLKNPRQPKPRLFTVGRLDVVTTGLIIVTNDGDFAQKLSDPSSKLMAHLENKGTELKTQKRGKQKELQHHFDLCTLILCKSLKHLAHEAWTWTQALTQG